MQDADITGNGKSNPVPNIIDRFVADLQAAGIDPATVFVADEMHTAEPDDEVLAKMTELVRAGRSTAIDWSTLWREEMRHRGQVATLEAFEADPQLRAQLAQVTLGGAR